MLATLTVLTACDSAPPVVEPSTTTPTTTTALTSTQLPYGAPSVKQPLDADSFFAEPCRSLTGPQLAKLRLGVRDRQDLKSDLCQFFLLDGDKMITVDVMFDRRGLVAAYRANADGAYLGWKPMEIGGYPAVRRFLPEEHACFVEVGISDSTVFYVLYSDPEQAKESEDCGPAPRIAPEVLATVRGAQ